MLTFGLADGLAEEVGRTVRVVAREAIEHARDSWGDGLEVDAVVTGLVPDVAVQALPVGQLVRQSVPRME